MPDKYGWEIHEEIVLPITNTCSYNCEDCFQASCKKRRIVEDITKFEAVLDDH
ncbi:MAG: hypothetical protein Q7R33_07925 [Nitrosarchaeum sp.]|nr:hypothetical protein [Nitrosarchaeum sp.]